MANGFQRYGNHKGLSEMVVADARELYAQQPEQSPLIAQRSGARSADAGIVLHLMVLAGQVGQQGHEVSIAHWQRLVGGCGAEDGVCLVRCSRLHLHRAHEHANPEDRQHHRHQYSRFLSHHF